MVKIPVFHCQGGPGLIPGRGTKILQAVRRGQKKKKNGRQFPKRPYWDCFLEAVKATPSQENLG